MDTVSIYIYSTVIEELVMLYMTARMRSGMARGRGWGKREKRDKDE